MNPHQRYIPLSDASANLVAAEQIVLTAKAYARAGFKETQSNNSDAWIMDLWQCYVGPGNSIPASRAYCTVFVTVCVDEAMKLLGNPAPTADNYYLPGYSRTWGNTRNLLTAAQSAQHLSVSKTPSAGAIFYRRSASCTPEQHKAKNIDATNENACGSSGHSGIVTDVRFDEYGNYSAIETVEGNASTEANDQVSTDEGIGTYTYEKDSPLWFEVEENDWWFIRVNRTTNGAAAVQTGTTDCLNVSVQQTIVVTNSGGSAGEGQEGTPGGTGAPETEEINLDDLPPEAVAAIEKRKACKDKYFVKACCEDQETTMYRRQQAIDYRYVGRNHEVIHALLGANGSHPTQGEGNRELYEKYKTWLPHLTDSNGNLYWVFFEADPVFKLCQDKGIFGPQPLYVSLPRTDKQVIGGDSAYSSFGPGGLWSGDGGGYKERLATLLEPKDERMRNWGVGEKVLNATAKLNEYHGHDQYLQDVPNVGSVLKREIFEKLHPNIHESIRKFEAAGHHDFNIVYVFTGSPITSDDVITTVVSGLRQIAGPIASAVGIPVDYLLNALTFTEKAATGQRMVVSDFANMASDMLITLDVIPADEEQQIRQLIKKTDTLVEAVNHGNINAVISGTTNLYSEIGASGYLPEVVNWIDNAAGTAESSILWVEGAYKEVEKYVGGELNKIMKTADGFVNAHVAGTLNALAQAAGGVEQGARKLFTDLVDDARSELSGFSIVNIPDIRHWLTSVPHGNLLATMPNATEIIGKMFSVDAVYNTNIGSDPHLHAAFAAVATGRTLVDDILDQFQLDAFLTKAEKFAASGWQMMLSDTVVPEKRECYEQEIRICTGLECCPPKLMVNGYCITPRNGENYSQADVIRNRQQGPGQFESPQSPVVLYPDCIRVVSGEFYYCPPSYCRPGEQPQQSNPTHPEGFPTQPNPASSGGTLPNNTTVPFNPDTDTFTRPRDDFRQNDPLYGAQPTTVGDGNKFFEAASGTATNALELVGKGIEWVSQLIFGGTQPDCSVMYPAKPMNIGTQQEQWYAFIGGSWIELVACCPKSQDCCSQTQSRLIAIENAVKRLHEMILRRQAGEQSPVVDLSSIRQELRELRALVASPSAPTSTQTPVDHVLRQKVERLATLVEAQRPYEDAALRQEITRNREVLLQLRQRLNELETGNGQTTGRPVEQYDDTQLRQLISTVLERLNSLTRNSGGYVTYDDTNVLRKIEELRAILRNLSLDELSSEVQTVRELIRSMSRPSAYDDTVLMQWTQAIARSIVMHQRQSETRHAEVLSEISRVRESLQDMNSRLIASPGNVTVDLEPILTQLRDIRARQDSATVRVDTSQIEQLLRERYATKTDLEDVATRIITRLEQIGHNGTAAANEQEIRQLLTTMEQQHAQRQERMSALETQINLYREQVQQAQQQQAQQQQTGQQGSSTTGQASTATSQGTRAHTGEDDCPDCPAVVETHTRKIYKYPTHQTGNHCDDC